MRRRQFITLLGGAAARPLAARAQQTDRVRKLGVLAGGTDNDPILSSFIDAFNEELQKLGWVKGRNLQTATLFATGGADQMRATVSQVLAIGPEGIVTNNTPIVLELQRRAPTVPIVFVTLADPVDTGIVASLAHPGGNTTGFMNAEPAMSVKWLELLKEIAPHIDHVLVMVNAGNAGNAARLRVIEAFAPAMGVRVSSYAIRDRADIESSIRAVAGQPSVGIVAAPASPINELRDSPTRREFLTLLGGAAAAWPIAARAQQQTVPVVGYLSAQTEAETSLASFRKGLSEAGFIVGRNVRIEFRAANNDYSRLAEFAADLVRSRVDAIYASGGLVAALAAKAATTNTPIVFAMGDDPITSGLVPSLNRPGANVTGIAFLTYELGPKRLELLKEVVPKATHYALLVNPDAPNTKSFVAELSAAADSIGRHIEVFEAGNVNEIDAAFAELVRQGADAVIVGSNSLLNGRRVQLAILASHYRLPAIYYDRRAVEVGGLMSYGADIDDAVRQAGIYLGRTLKVEKAADLPVMQATKFAFAINLPTARTLGLTVPPALLAIADEVIE